MKLEDTLKIAHRSAAFGRGVVRLEGHAAIRLGPSGKGALHAVVPVALTTFGRRIRPVDILGAAAQREEC